MRRENLVRLLLFVFISSVGVAIASAQNLLVNGDFENPDIPLDQCFFSNAQFLGWTVRDTQTGVCLVDNAYAGGGTVWHDTPSGTQFIYLNNNARTGAIEQLVFLESGSYFLEFLQADYATAFASPSGKIIASVREVGGSYVFEPTTFVTPPFSSYISNGNSFNLLQSGFVMVRLEAVSNFGGLVDNVILSKLEAEISGSIELQDFGGVHSGLGCTIDIVQDGQIAESHEVTLNESGTYSLRTTIRGEVVVCAKAWHWLRSCSNSLLLTDNGFSSLSFSLTNGDIDLDNEVGIGDYAILSSSYGSEPGNLGWVAAADLTGDQSVDIADYAVLSANYGTVGD